jgi:arylsulfatase A-like enzyme
MQPNFLLFITDQQRADHVCSYGNAMLRTPALDALAAQGWSADRFYVGSPICMPNRATMMTGRMPSVHGVRHNGIPLSQRATTFVERLRGAGYATALIGKSHLQNMTGKGPLWPPPPSSGSIPSHGEAWAAEPGRSGARTLATIWTRRSTGSTAWCWRWTMAIRSGAITGAGLRASIPKRGGVGVPSTRCLRLTSY